MPRYVDQGGGCWHGFLDGRSKLPRSTVGELDSQSQSAAEACVSSRGRGATISDQFEDDELRRMGAVARYIVMHDMIHVLLGCDTSIPGEMEVGGFVIGQRYFRASKLFALHYAITAPILSPRQVSRSYASLRRGFARAQGVPMLLAEPLEAYFADDLEHVRARLGLG